MQPSTLTGYLSFSAQNAGSRMWQPRSPSEPVPKSHQARQLLRMVGRVVRAASAPGRSTRPSRACRARQAGCPGGRPRRPAARPGGWSRRGPRAPRRWRRPRSIRRSGAAPSPEWPWLPICVTTLCLRAASVMQARFARRSAPWASARRRACPARMAAMAMTAWVWSGVATMTASMSFCLSSISR